MVQISPREAQQRHTDMLVMQTSLNGKKNPPLAVKNSSLGFIFPHLSLHTDRPEECNLWHDDQETIAGRFFYLFILANKH